MVPIMELWLPIVLATLLCFLAGAILHMAVPLHKNDWRPIPDEDGVMAALRKAGVTAGNYMFPAMSPEMMKDPARMQKLAEGPSGVMTVRPPGPVTMGPFLAKQFVFHLVISFVIAYVAGRTMAPATEYLQVFRVTGTVAILSYFAALVPEAIWYHRPGNYMTGHAIDGLVWGLLTAGSFAGFWPGG
jgi:hypothetical protein